MCYGSAVTQFASGKVLKNESQNSDLSRPQFSCCRLSSSLYEPAISTECPPPGPFQQASTDYLRSSVAVASALTSSLQTVASQQKSGTLQPFAIQLVSSSYSTWVENLAEVNLFADFDAAAKANPSAVISTPISSSIITQGVQQANAMGFTTATPDAFLQYLQSYQATLTTSAVLQQATSGSKSLFTQLGLALTHGFIGPQPVPEQSQTNPDHSGDCRAFAYAGIFAGLVGNEIAAAICAYECFELC